jgi:hypothetical protein
MNAGAGNGPVITCDGELDEALTELAGEGLRPVVPSGHDLNGRLGAGAAAS